MLTTTDKLLPHLIKQTGEDDPTLDSDGCEIYDVPSDHLWKLVFDNNKKPLISQVQVVKYVENHVQYIFELQDDSGTFTYGCEERDQLSFETFSLIPLVLVTS